MKDVHTLECQVCYQYYDHTERQPFQLNCCIHRMCRSCINRHPTKLCGLCGNTKKFEVWKCVPLPALLEVVDELRGLKVIGDVADDEVDDEGGPVDSTVKYVQKWAPFYQYYKRNIDSIFKTYSVPTSVESKFDAFLKIEKCKFKKRQYRGRLVTYYILQDGVKISDSEFEQRYATQHAKDCAAQALRHKDELYTTNFPSVREVMNASRLQMALIYLPEELSESSFFEGMFGFQKYIAFTDQIVLIANFQFPPIFFWFRLWQMELALAI